MTNRKLKSRKKRTRRQQRKYTRKHLIRSIHRKFRGGASLGSDIRQKLVTSCKRGNWEQYNDLTQKIIDYSINRKDFFIHLDRNIHTFKQDTLSCLKQSMIQLKANNIPDAILFLYYILCKNNEWQEYDDLTQQIMKDYWVNGKKDFFIYLDRNIKTFNPEILSCLKQSLTQLQEDAIPESMPHLAYIMQRRL